MIGINKDCRVSTVLTMDKPINRGRSADNKGQDRTHIESWRKNLNSNVIFFFNRIEMPHPKDSEERQISCQGIFALCNFFFGASFSLRACEWKYWQV